MPGLLDFLEPGYGTDDPRSAAYTALAAGLLGGKGSFGSILGESLLGAQNVYSRAVKDSQASQLNKAQLEEIARKAAAQKKAQAAEDAFRATLVSPQMQASQSALAGGGGPTVQNAAGMAQVDPQQQQLYKMVELGLISPVDYVKMTQKDTAPIKLGAGEKLLRPGTFQELAANPKEDSEKNAFLVLMKSAGIDPASNEGRSLLRKRLDKEATATPLVQVGLLGPTPMLNPKTGLIEMVQPGNKPGAPAQVVRDPVSGSPYSSPPQNRDVKLPAEIQRMNIAADSMVSLLDDYGKWLKSNNPRDPVTQMSATKRADMQSLMKNLQLQYKELAALGALTGPDLDLMEKALSDPFTARGAYYGRDGLLAQIEQAKKLVDVRRKAIAKSQGKPEDAAPATDNDPLGLFK